MNLTRVLRPARRILAATAVAVVTATCLVSANTTSAAGGHDRPDITQATKEWKGAPSSTHDVVLATKEWKVGPLRTKEW